MQEAVGISRAIDGWVETENRGPGLTLFLGTAVSGLVLMAACLAGLGGLNRHATPRVTAALSPSVSGTTYAPEPQGWLTYYIAGSQEQLELAQKMEVMAANEAAQAGGSFAPRFVVRLVETPQQEQRMGAELNELFQSWSASGDSISIVDLRH